MIRSSIIFLFLITQVLSVNSAEFNKITSVDGLSHNTVLTIVEDTLGFMWFGTRDGLNKYDGYRITQYYQTTDSSSLSTNSINKLLITKSGQLLVATKTGVCVYNQHKDVFKRIKETQGMNVFNVLELSDRFIFMLPFQTLIFDKNFNQKSVIKKAYKSLIEYKEDVIWGILPNNNLQMLNANGEVLRTVPLFEDVGIKLQLECLFKDKEGVMWVGTSNEGLYFYDADNDVFKQVKLFSTIKNIDDKIIRLITEDRNNNLWVGTESGIYIYNKENGGVLHYSKGYNDKLGHLNDNPIYALTLSSDNIMWVGTYFGGVNYMDLSGRGFKRIYADGGINYLSGNAVSEIIEYDENVFWIATEDAGITVFDKKQNVFSYINANKQNQLKSNNIHALAKDRQGNVYIGTFVGGILKYNKKTKTISSETIRYDGFLQHSIYCLYVDENETVWAGGVTGIFIKEKNSREFKPFMPEVFNNKHIYDLAKDGDGNLWVAAKFMGIIKIQPNNKVVRYSDNNIPGLKAHNIIDVEIADDGNIWFGTLGQGLVKFQPSDGSFITYTTDDGLPNNVVYKVVVDTKSIVWFSTNRGLCRFDPVTDTFTNYTERDGLTGNQFNFKSGFLAGDGSLLFGSVNGLTYFHAQNLKIDSKELKIYFNELKVFNKSVEFKATKRFEKHIDFLDELHLKFKDKVFTISYHTLNYLTKGNNGYAYYLEGFEEDWNYVGNNTSATYTNLAPGKYTFKVKALNNNGDWSTEVRSLPIIVHPPWWLTVWGFIFYGVVILSVVLVLRFFYMKKNKAELNSKLALVERNKMEELNQHRLNFFTYISHEFKTPLTLIISTLDHFLKFEDVVPKYKSYGTLIKKNASRLLFLINQLMEFRKIESEHASVKLNNGDVVAFLQTTFYAFRYLFENKHLQFGLEKNYDSYIAYFDADKLEKIVTNLIINAYKSTPEHGKIFCSLLVTEDKNSAFPDEENSKSAEIHVTIMNTGVVLSDEKIQTIFEPFFSESNQQIVGTGIGLSLVKSLTKLLNGDVAVSSSQKGGTRFTISLPLIFKPSTSVKVLDGFVDVNNNINISEFEDHVENEIKVSEQNEFSNKEYLMLIVEDNKELGAFLSQHFGAMFKIKMATDGLSALSLIEKNHPDIIISDVMMPKMDGLELCQRIKDDIATSHIPIILLTAKSGDESRMKGLKCGADAFISKPFILKELDFKVRNILKSQQSLKKQLRNINTLNDSLKNINNKDQLFIKKLTDIIYKNLDNSDFDVDMFTKELAISRTLLYTRIKKITGKSTTEFIRFIRLTEAKKLIETTDMTISEIAFKVGFNDATYFSRMFKGLFGKTPSSLQ